MRIALALLPLLSLAAPDKEVATRARQDVERELQRLAAAPESRATIAFSPSAGRGYALEEATFDLDGRPLPLPPLAQLAAAKGISVFQGPLPQGNHELVVHLVYSGDFGILSYMTGYKFKLQQRVLFETRRGLEVALEVAPQSDLGEDWRRRLSIHVERSQTMLAQVDATEPEPLARPAHAELASLPPPPVTEVAPVEEKPEPAAPKHAGLVKAPVAERPQVALAVAKEPPSKPEVVTAVQMLAAAPEPPAPAMPALAPLDSAGASAASVPGALTPPLAPLPVQAPHRYGLLAAGAALVLAGAGLAFWVRRRRSLSRPAGPPAEGS